MTARNWLTWGLVLGLKWGTALAAVMALFVAVGDEFWFTPGLFSFILGFPLSLVTIQSFAGVPLLLAFIWVPFANAIAIGLVLGVCGMLYESLTTE